MLLPLLINLWNRVTNPDNVGCAHGTIVALGCASGSVMAIASAVGTITGCASTC